MLGLKVSGTAVRDKYMGVAVVTVRTVDSWHEDGHLTCDSIRAVLTRSELGPSKAWQQFISL